MNPKFSHTALSSLPMDERALRLQELELELARQLAAAPTSSDFVEQAKALVLELRMLGHDLFSFDADDEFEIWCGDWTKECASSPLVLTFRFPGVVRAEWSTP